MDAKKRRKTEDGGNLSGIHSNNTVLHESSTNGTGSNSLNHQEKESKINNHQENLNSSSIIPSTHNNNTSSTNPGTTTIASTSTTSTDINSSRPTPLNDLLNRVTNAVTSNTTAPSSPVYPSKDTTISSLQQMPLGTSDAPLLPSLINTPIKSTPHPHLHHLRVATGGHNRRASSRLGIGSAYPKEAPQSAVLMAPIVLPSLWTYFQNELKSSDFDDGYAVKNERVANFLSVPLQVEKLLMFGYLICLDSFLYIFTILPIRIFFAFCRLLAFIFTFGRTSAQLRPSEKCDLLKGLLMVACSYMLFYTDSSRLYHSVRGQSAIKLYVIFNVLEICDKLCSAFGHDILDSLFSKATVSRTHQLNTEARRHLGKLTHFIVSLLYVFGHTMVLFYMVMTLNVAVNSYSNALLTLLLSNQFVEIKGSVFKKFEKENLFQLSCADIVERFQLSVFMSIITIRNYVELTGGGGVDTAVSYLYSFSASIFTPSKLIEQVQGMLEISFSSWMTPFSDQGPLGMVSSLVRLFPVWFSGIIEILARFFYSSQYKMIETLLTPAVMVIGTELVVDWLKHAFITKFNQIKPYVYDRYMDSLCRDLVSGISNTQESGPNRNAETIDQSPNVARRIGFVTLPLACLVIRVFFQTIQILDDGMSWSLLPLFSEFPRRFSVKGIRHYVSNQGIGILTVFTGVLLVFISLLMIKIYVGMYLLNRATQRIQGPGTLADSVVPGTSLVMKKEVIGSQYVQQNIISDVPGTPLKSKQNVRSRTNSVVASPVLLASTSANILKVSTESSKDILSIEKLDTLNEVGVNNNTINGSMTSASQAHGFGKSDIPSIANSEEQAAAPTILEDEKLDQVHRFSFIKRIV